MPPLSEASSKAQTPSSPSPRTSPTDQVSASLPRSRSVQFSDSANDYKPFNGHEEINRQQAESSADEITPIMSRERGKSGKSKSYDATASASKSVGEESGASKSSGASRARGARGARKMKQSSGGETTDQQGGGEGKEKKGSFAWWGNMLEKFGSVELENKGSVARDHLALERTFLAWLRTSLAFASIGIAVTQLFRLNTSIAERDGFKATNPPNTYHLRQVGKPLGATFLGVAILVLVVAVRRFFESQYWILRGKFPASRGSIFLITFVALSLIISSLVIVVTVDPSSFGR